MQHVYYTSSLTFLTKNDECDADIYETISISISYAPPLDKSFLVRKNIFTCGPLTFLFSVSGASKRRAFVDETQAQKIITEKFLTIMIQL